MGAKANTEDHYSAQVESAEEWTVKRQLAGKPKAVVDLYERFVRLLTACGPYTVSESDWVSRRLHTLEEDGVMAERRTNTEAIPA